VSHGDTPCRISHQATKEEESREWDFSERNLRMIRVIGVIRS